MDKVASLAEDIDLILDWREITQEDPEAGSFKLLPPEFRIAELKKDYKAMEHMIFDKYLAFEEILKTLQALENEINSLGAK